MRPSMADFWLNEREKDSKKSLGKRRVVYVLCM